MEQNVGVFNLSKTYGKDVEVLKDINFQSKGGEFIVLLGPSGCGKSTLLNLFAGLIEPTKGSIHINGVDVTEKTPKERNIAMVFQSYALYPNMNVQENMAFGLKKSKKMTKSKMKSVVENVAEQLQLVDLLSRYPKELSGGQRQRVAMGRAISRQPSVYLFDEPLSNLDAKLRSELRMEIKLLHKKEGNSILYVTHDQIEAMTLADRIVVLNKGAVQQDDTPLEIYNNPANMFVASFMGSPPMNFIPIKIKEDPSKGLIAHVSSATKSNVMVDLNQCKSYLSSYANQEITLAIRPEKILEKRKDISEIDFFKRHNQSIDDYVSISAPVFYSEETGAESFTHFMLNDKKLVCRYSAKDRVDDGELMNFYLPRKAFLFFDSSTGKRVR